MNTSFIHPEDFSTAIKKNEVYTYVLIWKKLQKILTQKQVEEQIYL